MSSKFMFFGFPSLILYLLTLIMFSSKNIHAIKCLPSNFSVMMSFDDFDVKTFQESLNILTPFVQETKCRVKIYVDYQQQTFSAQSYKKDSIQFQTTDVNLQTEIQIKPYSDTTLSKPVSTTTLLHIECLIHDWCDREFMLQHIKSLRNHSYLNLENELCGFLYANTSQTGNYMYRFKSKNLTL